MKYEIRITQVQSGYIGYALKAGEVVYSTALCRDSLTASRSVAEYIKGASRLPAPGVQEKPKPPISPASVPDIVEHPPIKKCCGRG